MTNVIPATKARSKFFKILEEIDEPNKTITITLDGLPKAVILSFDEYESYLETLEILRDTRLIEELKKAEKEFQKKEFVTLEKILKEEGYVSTFKSKKSKNVRSSSSKKGSQKAKKT
ncbi:type II toxin-antitoxin system Phd/YefM family antitoxin [Patescibacteria group bacterium]